MYGNNEYGGQNYGQRATEAPVEDVTDDYDEDDAIDEVEEDDDENVASDAPKKAAAPKKKGAKSTKLSGAARTRRRQLLTSYDFLKNTVENNEGIKDKFLTIVRDFSGPADDLIDITINLSALEYYELKRMTKVADFAVKYIESQEGSAGMEEAFALGLAYEAFSDEEKDIAKAVLGSVTGADMTGLKKTSGGLEVLMTLAKGKIDETYVSILRKIRGTNDFIDWK